MIETRVVNTTVQVAVSQPGNLVTVAAALSPVIVQASPVGVPGPAGSASWGQIPGNLDDQVDLKAALDGKAATAHGHAIVDVTGLQAALDGKAATAHGHAVADVTGLQAALDGKAATAHGHAVADVTGLQASLDGKAATVHGHAVADVTGLQASLNGKQAALPSGSGVVTLAQAGFEIEQTIAAPGVTPGQRVFVGLAPGTDADENVADMTDLIALAGFAGSGQITVTAAFSGLTSGPILINWSAF